MNDDTWTSFYLRRPQDTRYVGMLPVYLNRFLEASNRRVAIAHEYAAKAVEKHGLEPVLLGQMPACLRHGEVFHDREKHLTFVHYSDDVARWFQLTIKCCNQRKQLFVVTFHGLGVDDVRRLRRRYQKVWPLER